MLLRGSWGSIDRRGFVSRRECWKQTGRLAEAEQNWQNRQKESGAVGPLAWLVSTTMWPSSRQPHQPPKRSGPVRNETVRRRRAARRFAMTRTAGQEVRAEQTAAAREGARAFIRKSADKRQHRLARVACGGSGV